jgi:hypothetical protein
VSTPSRGGGGGGGRGAATGPLPGTCVAVTEGADDACPGECGEPTEAERLAHPAQGFCGSAKNAACSSDEVCASRSCYPVAEASREPSAPSDTSTIGRCCNTECDVPCETCVDPASPGVCIRRECGAYACVTAELTGDKVCLDACVDTSECAAGFQCVAGKCTTPPDVGFQDTACAMVANGQSEPRGLVPLGLGMLALRARRRRVRANGRAGVP